MKQAIGIAVYPALVESARRGTVRTALRTTLKTTIGTTLRTTLRTTIGALAASALLSACGGGAATTENPITQAPDPGNSVYTGPAPGDDGVFQFQQEFWSKARTSERCGACHNESVAQVPMFVRNDDVNLAYDAALTVVDINQPSQSHLVTKVGGGHNCWVDDPNVCAEIMTTWIENWLGGNVAAGGRQIVLQPPAPVDPGASKNFPEDPSAFRALIHEPILAEYCAACHSSESPNAQAPFIADPNVETAYAAAKSKINLDTPASSRLVIRLRNEFHNCWNVGCAQSAQIMEDAIAAFSDGITPTTVDPALVTSKALRLVDGTIASGGNRYEEAQIALYEFKTGSGTVAYDTSGVDPAIDLNLTPDVTWFGGWGITLNGGKAQGSTTASAKLFDILQESGEFSIEAWVIPANVTQEEARIVSYSAGETARNFTLQQTLYDYDFKLRTNETSLNGDPALSTPSADEVLQASLQHVVATYDPVNGRSIYVNGDLVTNTDPVPGGTLVDWQDTFAFVLGNEASGTYPWLGTLRMVAVHRRALTEEQIVQNFDVGVGEKFFMLFDISEIIQAAEQSSFILFEVQQFDSWAYLFDKPHFTTLDGSTPEDIPLEGLRIGMNGQEVRIGQTYATMTANLSASEFGELGQPLSIQGAVLGLEKGPEADEFFLTFDRLADASYDRPEDPVAVITPTDLDAQSRIGLRSFDEIGASYAAITGVDPTAPEVYLTFQELRQSLPAVEDINTFLSSHQVAIAQLAIQYCDAMVESNPTAMFPGFDFDGADEFATNRDAFVNPLIDRVMGTGLDSQPARAEVYAELASHQSGGGARPDNLIDRLRAGGSDTRAIAKGVCAAMLGSAVTLVQ